MAAWSDTLIGQRAECAESDRRRILPYVRACLEMTMPWRQELGAKDGSAFQRLFDSTGPIQLSKAANRIQRDMTPPFQRWFELEAGPLVPDKVTEQLNRQLEPITMILHAALNASAFAQASVESYADFMIGTGAMLAREGDERMPIHWIAAPAWELAFENGPSGRADNVFFKRRYEAWKLPQHWPKAQWSKRTQKLIDQQSSEKVEVRQSSYYDPEIFGWRLAVQELGGDQAVVWDKARDRTNPWIIYRHWTTPGDPWGRGPVMLALPDIRTANKTVELILTAAAYALAPPLMVSHDGVVNPDTMNLAPRSIIRVARTGGPMGPSIMPMPLGSNVDVGNLVLQDQRETITKALNGTQLPPPTGAVRSASEIIARTKDMDFDNGAAYSRLNHEFVPQVVARLIDVLDRQKVASIHWDALKVDHVLLGVKVTSPMARSQNLEDVQTITQFWEVARSVGGEQAFLQVANTEDGLPRLAKLMGVPLWAVNDEKTRAQLAQAAGALVAHQIQQNAQAQPGAAPGASAGGAAPTPVPLSLVS